jgi:hypothetical protein
MRKALIGLLAAALVLFGALLPLVLPRHCPVNRAACERIEKGMTQAEVYAILGGPPGDYRTTPPGLKLPVGGLHDHPGVQWLGDEGDAWVEFEHGVVTSTSFWEVVVEPAGPIDVILWRLERLFQ